MGLHPVVKTIGGVAPLEWLSAPTIIIDVALNDYEIIWAVAGHPRAVFPTSYAELSRYTGATPMIVGD